MKTPYILLILFALGLALEHPAKAQHRHYKAPKYDASWSKPGHHPDHIVLNLTEDPSTSMSVSWRTDSTVLRGVAEIAVATAAPKFWRNAHSYPAETEVLDAREVMYAGSLSHYHTVTFRDLLPDTLYAYRVGEGDHWSEWFQFRTAADSDKPFSFLYVGDAQNNILDLWARLIREGYRKAPDASFILHAGDLVNRAHSEQEWHEWYTAGSFIHSMLPSISTPGNHEYQPRTQEEYTDYQRFLSVQWRPQFNLPLNGIPGYEETMYYTDYQNARIISLDSNRPPQEQQAWLEQVLESNPKRWSIVTFHHPIYSASARRDNPALREAWKPIMDKHGVDLVLQGHDHSYARGRSLPWEENVVDGMNALDYTGTVYVVSVSGGKMYNLEPTGWENFKEVDQERAAENTQLFQVITVNGPVLSYESYTATGELYDAFNLEKSADGAPNRFIERKHEAISERRFENTIPYYDTLPEELESKILKAHKGFQINRVTYFEESGQKGFYLRLYKGNTRLDLVIDREGKVLQRN